MSTLKLSDVVQANLAGNIEFSAEKIRAQLFGGLMDPIIGFDHFKLTRDVFGAHPHAGMSAISYLFEDSVPYHNLDSIGTDIVIKPGSLLWTWAGSGVVHTEYPVPDGSEVHGLQLFINIPAAKKQLAPNSTYIDTAVIPEIISNGLRVRVAAGTTGTVTNPIATPEPLTFLHLFLAEGKDFNHTLPAEWTGTVYMVNGNVDFETSAGTKTLEKASVIAFGTATTAEVLKFNALADAELIFLSGQPLNEQVFAQGSLTMSSPEELNKALSDFKAGKMGFIEVENGERKVILPVA